VSHFMAGHCEVEDKQVAGNHEPVGLLVSRKVGQRSISHWNEGSPGT